MYNSIAGIINVIKMILSGTGCACFSCSSLARLLNLACSPFNPLCLLCVPWSGIGRADARTHFSFIFAPDVPDQEPCVRMMSKKMLTHPAYRVPHSPHPLTISQYPKEVSLSHYGRLENQITARLAFHTGLQRVCCLVDIAFLCTSDRMGVVWGQGREV